MGILGAALLYGDGAITPAISVLSALEGLNLPAPAMAPYILPLAVVVLVALFVLQRKGTAVGSSNWGRASNCKDPPTCHRFEIDSGNAVSLEIRLNRPYGD